MSLAGMIMREGSTATVYHGLDTNAADASSVRTYPTNTPDIRMLLEDVSDELLRRVFGQETKATVRALITDRGVVLLKGDIVVVTAGAVHAGERFKIDGTRATWPARPRTGSSRSPRRRRQSREHRRRTPEGGPRAEADPRGHRRREHARDEGGGAPTREVDPEAALEEGHAPRSLEARRAAA
jgi:hypothetical protein